METFFIIVACYFCAAMCGGIIGGIIIAKYFVSDFTKFVNTILNEQYAKEVKTIKMLEAVIARLPIKI